MKKHYFVGQRVTKDGKCYAISMEVTSACNLADPTLVTLNVCDTKKDALRLMELWNENFKKAGIYAW